jgi:hypothetical protein
LLHYLHTSSTSIFALLLKANTSFAIFSALFAALAPDLKMSRLGGMFRSRTNNSDGAVKKNGGASSDGSGADNARIRLARPYILAMTLIVSIGGFIFGE